MPKLMRKIIIDERRLVELIKLRPELYDPLNEHSKDNNRKKNAWNEVSLELDASVDLVKKVWRKLRMNYDRTCKDQDVRRSARLNTDDGSLDFLPMIGINANGNGMSSATAACNTSENCESSKRVLRSGLQLSTITGTELTSLSSSFDPNKTQAIVFHDNEHQESTINGTNDQTNQRDIGDSGEPADNVHKQDNKKQDQIIVEKSGRSLRPRQLTMLTDATKENNSPLRSPKMISNKLKNKQKKFINFHGATRAFFESIAMTVSSFPLHYQSSIKKEIYNIVAETEHKLSLKQKA